MNVLFLGNSLIFYNDLPNLFHDLATAGGQDITVDSVTKGSATISHFACPTDPLGIRAREVLASRHWDYVIIEPSRRITPFEDTVLAAETAAAKTVQALAKEAGAQVVLYAVWGNNNGIVRECVAENPPHMPIVADHPYARKDYALFLQQVSHRISAELGGVPIIEAGEAFERLLERDGNIELYHTDLRHPSPAGSYLVACTIYATLFGQPSSGIPFTFDLPCADILQRIADQTVLNI